MAPFNITDDDLAELEKFGFGSYMIDFSNISTVKYNKLMKFIRNHNKVEADKKFADDLASEAYHDSLHSDWGNRD